MSEPLDTIIRMGKTFMWHYKGEPGASHVQKHLSFNNNSESNMVKKKTQGNCLHGKMDPAEMKNHQGSRSEWRRKLLG